MLFVNYMTIGNIYKLMKNLPMYINQFVVFLSALLIVIDLVVLEVDCFA